MGVLEIVAKTLTGQTVTLDVELSHTVSDILSLIHISEPTRPY